MPLNEQQEKVASHHNGRAWVVAGPGSGKTSTITARIGRLLDLGVQPFNILSITFTNKAADEMRHRMDAQYGERVKGLTVCTFHALCVRILKQYGESLGYSRDMVVWDETDQRDRMRSALRNKIATTSGNRTEDANDDEEDKGASMKKIAIICKVCNEWRENLLPDSFLQDYIDKGTIDDVQASAIREYLKRMRAAGAIDFAGLLSETYRLLKSDEDVRNAIRNRFHFLQVDEYQDTNRAQNQIIELITGPEDNVLAVGDPDQSIYSQR
jgi:DNA helicase-2/ATP-dependent DNA helicase PcrA